jgi:acyl-CoA thioesterase-1
MRAVRLYLLLIGSVLLLAGCGQDRSNPPAASDAGPSAATNRAADTASAASGGEPSAGGASAETPAETPAEASGTGPLRVLVLGNSIAAGYGLADPATQAFPARLQQRVDSLGWNVNVQNAGLSGETSAGGRRRIGWLLQRPVDVLVLELGGNDGLRGVDPAATRENLTAIIDTTLKVSPEARVLLAGMQVPPNLGADYTESFRQIYPAIAERYERVALIPFILEGVGGVDSLMQSDGIHPTAEGQRRVAATVWEQLRPVLERLRREREA